MLKEKLKNHQIILASNSPRRQQFLKDLDIPFIVRKKPVEEKYPSSLKHSEITDYLSELKAKVYKEELAENEILITSDTIVWHHEKALGKPSSKKVAFEMIQSLSGETHQVITSVTFTTQKIQKTVHDVTLVKFKNLSEEEVNFYIDNFDPMDKAGAYGIQEWIGLIGIERIEGSYFNVVGLPTHLVYKNLLEIISQ